MFSSFLMWRLEELELAAPCVRKSTMGLRRPRCNFLLLKLVQVSSKVAPSSTFSLGALETKLVERASFNRRRVFCT